MAKNEKLKIGIVLDTSLDKPDGVQQYVISIGEWLRKKGHDVHYLVGETTRQDLPNVHSLSKNISVQSNGNRTTIPLPTSRNKLKKFLNANKFDVLHVQVPHSPFLAQKIINCADPGTAVIGTFHIVAYSKLETLGTWLLGIWLKPSLRRFDVMLSVSTAAADFAKKTFKINSKILPNVIDLNRFSSGKPLDEYDNNKLTILFLGRLVPRKGCMELLKAITKLDRTNLPDFQVLICGQGHLEPQLRKFSIDNHLDEIVHFAGFIDEAEKPNYYASADISVFPSSGGESFGIVLLEAMASGKSVVLAGDNPGYRSVMSTMPQLLFDTKNADELAGKLKHYLLNADDRAKMSKRGSLYTESFDVNLVGQKLIKIYTGALQKRREK